MGLDPSRFLQPHTSCPLVLLLVLAASGCATPIQHAAFTQAPDFEPAALERVAMKISVLSREEIPLGAVGGVESRFTGSLMTRGYQVVASGANRTTSVLPLDIVIEPREVVREVREFRYSDENGNTRVKHVTFFVTRATVRGRLTRGDGTVLWSSDHTSAAESNATPNDASLAAVWNASAMVAEAFPFRRLPVNKKGIPYDPRLQAP